jgi:hypothetical protein
VIAVVGWVTTVGLLLLVPLSVRPYNRGAVIFCHL